MPIPNDYREIVSTLIEKTNEGTLSWFADNVQVSVQIDESKFSLWAGIDERSDEPFVAFGLSNGTHAAITGTAPNLLTSKLIDSWFVDESDPDYGEVYRLFTAAKRHANGVPSLLKHLSARLSEIKKQ